MLSWCVLGRHGVAVECEGLAAPEQPPGLPEARRVPGAYGEERGQKAPYAAGTGSARTYGEPDEGATHYRCGSSGAYLDHHGPADVNDGVVTDEARK
jgi:hypothetical protein